MKPKIKGKMNKKGGWNIKLKVENAEQALKFFVVGIEGLADSFNRNSDKKTLISVIRTVCNKIEESIEVQEDE